VDNTVINELTRTLIEELNLTRNVNLDIYLLVYIPEQQLS